MKNRFSWQITILPIIFIILTAGIFSLLNILELQRDKEQQIETVTSTFISQQKKMAKNRVMTATELIRFQASITEELVRKRVKERVDEVIHVANVFYKKYHATLSKKELEEQIKLLISNAVFDHPDGYFFAVDMATEKIIVHKLDRMVGHSMSQHKDLHGKQVLTEQKELLSQSDGAFQTIYFTKPTHPNKEFPKQLYVRYFKPFNWLIGTGEYIDDMEKRLQASVLKRLNTLYTESNEHLFVHNIYSLDGDDDKSYGEVVLSGNSTLGKQLFTTEQDSKGTYFRENILIQLRNHGEGFVTYWHPLPTQGHEVKKTSFFFYEKTWNWSIGSGFYYDLLEEQLAAIEHKIDERITKEIQSTIAITLLIVAIMTTFFFAISRRISKTINKYSTDLHQSNEREKGLADIVRNAPIAIAHGYPDGSLESCNSAFSELTGYSNLEMQKIDWNEVLTAPQWRAFEAEKLSQLSPTSNSVHYEKEYIRKDGSNIPIELTVTAKFDIDGKIINYTGFITDITKRKQFEQINKIYQQQLITILDNIDANVYVSDLKTHEILFTNKNMIQDFGQDLTGQTCWKCFREESGPCDDCKNDLLVDESGRPTDGCIWDNQNPVNGKYYINHDRAIEWNDGRLVHLQIATDISDVKSMEQELRQKYKMEAVGVMAGGMAHNFNNNLSIILGNLELTKLKLPDHPEVSEFLDHAKIAVIRSRDLVKQIMTYSRKGEQHNTPLQLSVMVEETINLIKSTIPSSIYLQHDIHSSTSQTSVLANASQIQEILLNLCNNAVHAMDERGTLALTLTPVELVQQQIPAQSYCQPGKYLCLSVQDTGCGMTPETQEKIFDPFFTTKEMYDGTGMGLSTVKGVMEQLQGMITVESHVGEGTTFKLYFPVVDQIQKAEADNQETALLKGTERILFVDDDKMLASLGEKLLTEMGYQVSVMNESTEALKMFTVNAEHFDLVITDQTMPQLSGKDLIVELKKVKPDIPTILCTGYSSKIDKDHAKELGINAFMMKPLNLMQLAQTVRRVLDGVEIE